MDSWRELPRFELTDSFRSAFYPAAHLILVRLLKGLWLAVDEVIHHDDVMLAIIILPRGLIGRDPDRRDARVVEFDTDEGQACIARRGRDKTAEDPLAVAIEILDQRAGFVWLASIWQVNVCEDHAEASDRCWRSPVGPGTKNEPSVTLLPTGVNNRDGLKVVKMVA